MLPKNMKIVVIGSNVKRRAGPRVGSEGYIIQIDKPKRTGSMPGAILCRATVLFTKYGFEKKTRLERVSVYVVAPDLETGANPRKAINKTIRNLQKADLSHMLVVAPARENPKDINECCAKIMTKLNSSAVIGAAYQLHANPFGGKGPGADYGDLNKLRAVMPNHVQEFLYEYHNGTKLPQLKLSITAKYFMQNKNISELYQFANVCEVLEYKHNKSGAKKGKQNPWRFRFGVNSSIIIGSLFDLYKFNGNTKRGDKSHQQELRKIYGALAAIMINKGSILIKKHK
jgi:hypothetical protein